jgi:hypothetical protein
LSRCKLAERTVRPTGVVMMKVLGQHPAQVVLADDQQPVEELAAQGADDSLADRVRSGRLRWAGQNPDAVRGEYGVEGSPGTLRVSKTLSPRCGCGRKACFAWRRPLSC